MVVVVVVVAMVVAMVVVEQGKALRRRIVWTDSSIVPIQEGGLELWKDDDVLSSWIVCVGTEWMALATTLVIGGNRSELAKQTRHQRASARQKNKKGSKTDDSTLGQ